jgi:ABC-2 type transport system permease protein
MHAAGVYFAYFRQFLIARLSYKADFFASIVANAVATLSGILFVVFLINGDSVQSIQGWSREEVLFVYGYSMLSMALFSTFAVNLYRFGDRYVIQGQFDRVLLRPVNSLFQVIFESFNLDTLGSLFSGVLLLIYSSRKLHIVYGPADVLWLLFSTISGAVILLSVFVAVASVSFHFEDRIGISAPVYNMINFGRYPISIFNRPLQFLLSWIIPFAFVAFYPATHFLQREGFTVFCYLTPVIAFLSAAAAAAAWRFGVAKYSSTGN